MSKIFCVVIVAIGILHSGVVQLSSSKDVCEEFTNFTSDIPLEDLHVNTSLQMCLGFTCPNVTLINEDFNYTPRASGLFAGTSRCYVEKPERFVLLYPRSVFQFCFHFHNIQVSGALEPLITWNLHLLSGLILMVTITNNNN